MNTISVDDLAALGPDVAIIDVREGDEYTEAHIEGTTSMPLSRFADSLGDLPSGRTLYLICASGNRSARATAWLTGQGFDAVNVDGGITEWYRNGHPVTYGTDTDTATDTDTGTATTDTVAEPGTAATDTATR